MAPSINGKLEDWSSVEADGPWPALLLGNGSSIAVWRDFGYDRLFDEAALTSADKQLFRALGPTTNFELVLAALRVSRLVCQQLAHADDEVQQRYDSIRDALIAAVNDLHVPWSTAQPDFTTIGEALLEHDAVYSTNYDLLAYWGLMSLERPRDWGDAFWNDGLVFDDVNVVPKWTMTMIHYLHGALHIYRTRSGTTVKRRAPVGRTLLDLLGTQFRGSDLPLFVSEGSSDDKMRVIRSSDYLSFAYGALEDEDRPLVVFGNSLSDQDAHLVRAINRWPKRRMAIALRPNRTLRVIADKTRLQQVLSGPLRFFDSETHPLGDPALQLAP